MVLMVTGLSSMLSVQDASHGAGHTRPVTSGKLLVECRLSAAVFQWSLVDEIVPVGDLVVHRAAVVAIGDAAIHAARRLALHLGLGQRLDELLPMLQPLLDRAVAAVVTLEFHEAGDLAHVSGLSPKVDKIGSRT